MNTISLLLPGVAFCVAAWLLCRAWDALEARFGFPPVAAGALVCIAIYATVSAIGSAA